jgi:hypothetical protein
MVLCLPVDRKSSPGRFEIMMDGMTGFEHALKSGSKEIPVKIFTE